MRTTNNSIRRWLASLLLFASIILQAPLLVAQAIAPERSAMAAAVSDTRFIANNIQDNQDDMTLLQKALDHSRNPDVKELAQQMIENHTAILYSFQELNAAGSGSNENGATSINEAHIRAAKLDDRLSRVSGSDFDTMWVANVLLREQAKFDELSQAKVTVTNPQLKMAVTEAVPLIRKHRSQLNTLQKSLARMAVQKKKQAAVH